MEPWRRLDTAPVAEAARLLARCCGSTRWVAQMLARRPFGGDAALHEAARDEWFALEPADWHEAFRHHLRIGDREALRARFADTGHLAAREQAGVAGTPDAVLDALAGANQIYEQRFGFIFIICATGKSAGEMLARLRERLANDVDTELRVAAKEQADITALRLASLGE